MRCIWNIRTSRDDVIVLTFDAFNTERCCDCLEVYDGTIVINLIDCLVSNFFYILGSIYTEWLRLCWLTSQKWVNHPFKNCQFSTLLNRNYSIRMSLRARLHCASTSMLQWRWRYFSNWKQWIMVWSHWARWRSIAKLINKSSQWHQRKGLAAGWTLLHITMKPIIIVLATNIVLALVLVQCEHTVSSNPILERLHRFSTAKKWHFCEHSIISESSFWSGPDTNRRPLAELCGDQGLGRHLRSSSSDLTLQFRSDSSVQNTGIVVNYTIGIHSICVTRLL